MKNFITIMCLMLLTITATAQINPQRPSLSESYNILDHRGLQFENGMDLRSDILFETGELQTMSSTFIRKKLGSTKWEGRYFTTYESSWSTNHLGLKRQLTSGNSWLNASILAGTNLDMSVTDVRFSTTAEFWRIGITGNLGYTNDNLYYIALVGLSITDDLGVFIETQDLQQFNLGLVSRRSEDIALDARVLYDDRTGAVTSTLGLSFILR